MTVHYISYWETWKLFCEHYCYDPYKTVELGLGKGGGNTTDFEYVGDIPEKEEGK